MSMIDNRPPQLARGMLMRFAAAAGIIVVLVCATASALLLKKVDKVVDAFNEAGGEGAKIEFGDDITRADAGDPQTVLLLGSDRRFTKEDDGVPPRSDTIMLLRLDPDRKFISVMSVPRDLLVSIPGHGRDKINQAYSPRAGRR